MMLARQAATMAQGRSRTQAGRGGGRRAHRHDPALRRADHRAAQGGRAQAGDGHHDAGRSGATAGPAPRLHDVVATTYGVNADGTYDGSIVGPFVWANGKLEAVRAWAERHDIDMAESYAYSDSVYDTPLLSAVGHPVAVNPDPRMLVMALARRWPVVHLDVPPGVPKLPLLDLEPQQLALAFTRPSSFLRAVGHRWRAPHPGRRSGDPRGQPPLVLRRHRRRHGGGPERPDRSLPGQEGGVRRADRRPAGEGHGRHPSSASASDEPLRHAAEALEAGQMVALMPEGTIPRGKAFFDPELKGRWGRPVWLA